MFRDGLKRAKFIIAGLVISSIPVLSLAVVKAANVAVTVDGSQKYQTMSGLGADINPNSWDNGNLKPALDMLVDQEGMKTFRVGMDMIDWESTNDDSDPMNFNWNYYNPIYDGTTSYDTAQAGSNFANTWAVIDYLHQKGIPDSQIELSFMGDGPSWMGGKSLTSGKEDEFVEEVLSAAYYGYTHGHTFGLFSPNNEMDISSNEGVTMSDTQWADVLNRLATRMNTLGMNGVQLVGPESCCNVGYGDAIKTYPTLMAKLAHFTFHNYTATDDGAAAEVAGTGKDFWYSEYNDFNQSFTYLDRGAAGLTMWEAYDSVYNHAVVNGRGTAPGNDSLSWGDTPLIAYNATTKTYTPRSNFYYFGQLFKWTPIGSQRVKATSGNSSVQIEAFQDPATSRLTLVGQNTSGSSQTLQLSLGNLPVPTSLQYYQTNSGSNMSQGADVPVNAGAASVNVPANTTFTLTGLGVPDSTAPSAPTTLSANGSIGSASLSWGASTDNIGVTGYNVYRSTTTGFTPSSTNKVGQSATTSYTDTGVAPGTYYYLVTAQDAAGNISPPSNEASATVTADTTAPTVSITAPTNGSTISGVTSITANASDNVGVAGVQFKLDGTNLGTEATGAPYSTSWNTTGVANGSHTLTAVARDAAGNTTTSTSVTVTVNNQAGNGVQLLGINTVQSSGDSNPAGDTEAFKYTATASGAASTVSFYVNTGNTATTLKVGIYSDNNGHPGTLLASGSKASPTAAAWNTLTLSSSPTLTAGTPYWITLLGTGGSLSYRDTTTGNCSESYATLGQTNLPATWSTGTIWPTCNLSAYVTSTSAPDTTAPTTSISSPANNATVSSQTTVNATATDNIGVTKVEFYVDGTLNTTDTTSPYSATLNTTTFSNGQHSLTTKAYDAAGNVGTSSAITVNVLNDTTPPTVPTGVSATSGGMTSTNVSWTASTDDVGVTGYHVWRNGVQVATTTQTSFNDTGLQSATTYNYTVTAFDAASHESAQSTPPASVTTDSDTTPPSMPNILSQTGSTSTTATLAWTASSDNVGVTGYDYFDSGTTPLGTTSTLSHTYTGLACGTTYTVGVDAYDAAGNRSTEATTTLSTDACDTTAPSTPSGLSQTGITATSATLSWATSTDNVGVTGYDFYDSGVIPLGNTTTTAHTYTGLTCGTTYTVGVDAYDASGNHSPEATTTMTTTDCDATPPSTPTGFTQSGTTMTAATLTWAASTDNVAVAGYDFFDAGSTPLGNTTTTSHTYTGLSCGNTYTVGVDAYDTSGNHSPEATTTLTTTACDTTAPTVSVTAPANNATVSGTVSVTANASDNVGVVGVQFKLDGNNLGAEDTTSPYSVSWNTTTATAGSHTLTAVARDAAGNVTTSTVITVTVNNAAPVTLDKQLTTHGSTKATSITSPSLTTSGPNELLVAFITSDGSSSCGSTSFSSVTGGNLTWTLRKRVNTRCGTSEIWTAAATSVVTNMTVKATRSSGSYVGSITVAAFKNANLTTSGAVGGASNTTGAPSASLTATKVGSVVWGVGNDWSRSTARTVGTGQTMVDQFLASSQADTFWVQQLNAASTSVGQTMTISDTAPTNDQWNLATIEILPAN